MAVSGRSKNPVVKTEEPHNTKTISCKTKKSARSGRPKKVAATTEDITINSATVKKCVPPPAEPRKPKITYTSIFGQGSTKKPIENPIIVAELNEENGLCDNMLSSPQRVLNVEVPVCSFKIKYLEFEYNFYSNSSTASRADFKNEEKGHCK